MRIYVHAIKISNFDLGVSGIQLVAKKKKTKKKKQNHHNHTIIDTVYLIYL